jgi:tetratricopeptide (TPR) repeat protein
MIVRSSLSLYNQTALSDDDFIVSFVARHELLETLLRRLRVAEPEGGGRHYVLIGSRGMGKTSLLRRIAVAINREPDLAARYVPLSFREEQYNVLTLGDFWRNCGESLAGWAEATGRVELAHRLDSDLLTRAWADDETSAEQFSAELVSLQRRAVLLVDNMDLIIDALPSDSNWTLRRYLQARQGPIVIGAAIRPLKQGTDRDAAFYEFFEAVYLDPLDEHQTEKCMRVLAHCRGGDGDHVIEVLDKQPERLKTLHTLTGGNPRILTLIYQLLEAGQSEAAMADLEILLDQVTPYYKAKIEEYQTPQQRAVIDAIALHWDPITTGNLAHVTSIATTTLSPLLMRLRKDGLIENVETSGAYAGHQLVERFFNIWYLMRHGTRRTKQKMRWLVVFLTSFYSLHDLADLARRADDKGVRKRWRTDYAFAFNEALERLSPSYANNDELPETVLEITTPADLKGTLPKNGKVVDERRLIEVIELTRQALEFGQAANYLSCLAALDEILARVGGAQETAFGGLVANVLFGKAVTLGKMGDSAAAVAVYNDVLARFGDAKEPALRECVARALVNKAVTLGQMGDSAAAVAVYNDILARFGNAQEPALRERVARALVNKAVALGQMGDGAAEAAAHDDVLGRFGDAEEPALREQVARVLINKAVALGQMGDSAAAVGVCDDVLGRFGDAQEPALREQVARAFVNKAVALGQMGDNAAAVAAYDDVLARFGNAQEPALREQVARALVNKAITLGQIGDSAAAVAAADDVLGRFGNAQEPALREQVARALANKVVALGQMGNSAAAVAAADDVLGRFGDGQEPALREEVARALVNKAIMLGQIGDSTAEIAVYDDFLGRFGDAQEPALREQVAMALFSKAITLGQIGDSAAEIAVYDDFLGRFGDAQEPALREQVAMALVNKAITLGQIGDGAAAVAVYDDVLARFGNAQEPALREQVAMALFNKAVTLGQMGASAAAVSTFERLLGLSNDDSTTFKSLFAHGRIQLANMLLDFQEEFTRAETLCREAAVVLPLFANANLAWLYLMANRVPEAIDLRASLGDLPAYGLALLGAAIKLAEDNFGSATDDLASALGGELDRGEMDFSDDLNRLLRLAERKGYGERLIAWFEKTGFADRVAPIYVAFKAYVRNEKLLLDVNPELRRPAQTIYDRLDAPRRHGSKVVTKKDLARRRREPRRKSN